MAHTIAGETFPLQVLRDEASPGARWVDKVVEGLALTIVKQCGDGWNVVAPGEPIVRTAIPRDPNGYRPSVTQLPALFGWVDTASPVVVDRIASEISVRRYELSLLWMPSPAAWTKSDKWSNFWVAIDEAISLAVNTQYSPWTTADAFGQRVADYAGLWELTLGQGRREPITVESAAKPEAFEAYIWRLNVGARVGFDQSVNTTAEPSPVAPNKISTDVTTPGSDDPFVLESRLPNAAWEP